MKYLVFAPGIMGTGLRNDRGSVWPPSASEAIFGYKRVDDLLGDDVRPTVPIRNVGPVGVYRTLLRDIQACGYTETSLEKRFISYPYDWRRSCVDSAERLADILDTQITRGSGAPITLLGHSMGGLILRYLLESGRFQNRFWFSSISNLVTLGTPHYGASLALFRLTGEDKALGLSGSDIQRIANDPRYPSAYQLIPQMSSAQTVDRPLPGDLPSIQDPFSPSLVHSLGMSKRNIQASRDFWRDLGIHRRPEHIDYLFIVGAALKTLVRNEWVSSRNELQPDQQKSGGDGTVPIASAVVSGVPQIYSQKKHSTIFCDRDVRRFLYRFLEAPAEVRPFSAEDAPDVGDEDALGLDTDQDVYDPGEDIEVVVTFNKEVSDPRENFELLPIDWESESGDPDPDRESRFISVRLSGARLSTFSFSIKETLPPGLYEIRGNRGMDDPEPTQFYVRGADYDH
ncbi:MAG: hypothetical protein AAGD06_25220 [Acidobacteriota bacterium]